MICKCTLYKWCHYKKIGGVGEVPIHQRNGRSPQRNVGPKKCMGGGEILSVPKKWERWSKSPCFKEMVGGGGGGGGLSH